MKTLALYLAEYITHKGLVADEYYTNNEWIEELEEAIREGVKAYESTEGVTVKVVE